MNEPAPSLVGRGRSLLDQVLRLAQTRMELIAAELQHEKLALIRQWQLALAAAICVALAGVSLILLLALVLPEESRIRALIAACVIFLGGALGCGLALRTRAQRPPLFSRVIHQLRLDRASLQEPSGE